jgi:hypothetical protein
VVITVVVTVVVKMAEALVEEASAVVETAATETTAAIIATATKGATHREDIADHLPLLIPDGAGCVPAPHVRSGRTGPHLAQNRALTLGGRLVHSQHRGFYHQLLHVLVVYSKLGRLASQIKHVINL